MTEVLYISSVASASQFAAMKAARLPGSQEVTYGMIESGHKFHTLLQAGLIADERINVTSLVGRTIRPDFYAGRFWGRVRERVTTNLLIDHLPLVNAKGVKQLTLAAGFFFGTLAWRWRTRRCPDRVMIADAAYISALPSVLLALRDSRVKKVAIFADIYAYMAEVDDASQRAGNPLFRAVRRVVPKLYRHLDGFILLTEAMNDVVNPTGKPHMVMEGVADETLRKRTDHAGVRDELRTVVYAGALREEYGLKNLVDGFRAYANPDARLVIFGGGDFVPTLEAAIQADHRISYGGYVSMADALAAEQRAWLLVNPRPIEEEFTKYSFPSKVMEYLSTGTPVLTTRLPGIPAEYFQYVHAIESSGPAGITEALERVLTQDPQALLKRAAAGRDFVLDHKNHVTQARRILDFARGC